ncbi:MAG: sigma-70 family RNA polymerase sigma factor [Pirellulaceae bacterium]
MFSEDQSAIDQTLAGDSAAFGELVERYQRRLQGLLWHACGDRELAEDIAQESFARAYHKLNLFSGESQFYTWLARIAMNLLASNRRKKRIENQVQREGFDVAIDSIGEQSRPDELAELNETQRYVRRAIDQLDEERRSVLVLRDFDGMDYEAIATTLEIPIGTVRSRLHRARQELRSILQQNAVQLGLSGI